MTDYAKLLEQLNNDTLEAGAFRHVDHIGVAYEALVRHSFFDALHTVATGIDRTARRAGALDKFNATITAAFMSLIAEQHGGGKLPQCAGFYYPEYRSCPWHTAARALLIRSAELGSGAFDCFVAGPTYDGSRQRLTIG